MKKIFVSLFALLLLFSLFSTLTSCNFSGLINGGSSGEKDDTDEETAEENGENEDKHRCSFTRALPDEEYRISKASCTEYGEYYYSCSCGRTGEETFIGGDLAPHDYRYEVAEKRYILYPASVLRPAIYANLGYKKELKSFFAIKTNIKNPRHQSLGFLHFLN